MKGYNEKRKQIFKNIKKLPATKLPNEERRDHLYKNLQHNFNLFCFGSYLPFKKNLFHMILKYNKCLAGRQEGKWTFPYFFCFVLLHFNQWRKMPCHSSSSNWTQPSSHPHKGPDMAEYHLGWSSLMDPPKACNPIRGHMVTWSRTAWQRPADQCIESWQPWRSHWLLEKFVM